MDTILRKKQVVENVSARVVLLSNANPLMVRELGQVLQRPGMEHLHELLTRYNVCLIIGDVDALHRQAVENEKESELLNAQEKHPSG